jgi:hypothetical protein
MNPTPLHVWSVVAAVALLTGCHGTAGSPDARETPHISAAMAEMAPTMAAAESATYWGGINRRVTLANGEWRGDGGAHVTLLRDFYGTGDINGDGAMNAVVILSVSNAGPETGQYLAVLRHDGLDTISLGTVRIGHPVTVRALHVDGRRISIDVTRRGPSDPECCPTEQATQRYLFGDQGLAEVGANAPR